MRALCKFFKTVETSVASDVQRCSSSSSAAASAWYATGTTTTQGGVNQLSPDDEQQQTTGAGAIPKGHQSAAGPEAPTYGDLRFSTRPGDPQWSEPVIGGSATNASEKLREHLTDEIIHTSAPPELAGTSDELLNEDIAAEADWRRLGNEQPETSLLDQEKEHFHNPHPHDDTHMHREDIKDSDSSAGA